jgi:hypothetical protein
VSIVLNVLFFAALLSLLITIAVIFYYRDKNSKNQSLVAKNNEEIGEKNEDNEQP